VNSLQLSFAQSQTSFLGLVEETAFYPWSSVGIGLKIFTIQAKLLDETTWPRAVCCLKVCIR
jgi:hypothetical protein